MATEEPLDVPFELLEEPEQSITSDEGTRTSLAGSYVAPTAVELTKPLSVASEGMRPTHADSVLFPGQPAREGISYQMEPVKEFRCVCAGRKILEFNWMVMILSIVIIWGFSIYCILDSSNARVRLGEAQSWIVTNFTWFYNGSLVSFMVFSIYMIICYGDIKLGKPDDEPDFSYGTWFTMLFSAGVGIGLFFFGVAEPVFHFSQAVDGKNRYAQLPLNTQATAGMNITWFHWGFTASSVYAVIGLPLAYYAHRHKMPMTIRTCFFHILGDGIYGILGDIIDTLAVVGTLFGVATSLGLGVIQLNTGLNYINKNIPLDLGTRVIIIWIVTAAATVSVATGLDVGIRRLSEVNFLIGLVLLFYLLFEGDTIFIFDYFVQTVGYHFQWLLQLMFHTDAFPLHGFWANPARPDYLATYSKPKNQADSQSFMETWTVFYWAWWIAWSPFVGVFIASISKGRTIREFILGNMVVPTVFTSIWLTIFGGLGIQMDMQSRILGYKCSKTAPFNTVSATNSTVIPASLVQLSCRSFDVQLFDLIHKFPLAYPMSIITLIAIVTYFVTSSDSASMVVDNIISNGGREPPVLQRIFWALMEGALATALLVAGGPDALKALQTASIAAGLPFCFVLLAMMWGTKRALDTDLGTFPGEDTGQYVWSFPFHSLICEKPSEFLLTLFCPCCVRVRTQMDIDEYMTNGQKLCTMLWIMIPVVLTIIFGGLAMVTQGYGSLAWIAFFSYVTIATYQRVGLRDRYDIEGGVVSDFLSSLFCYSCATLQEFLQVQSGQPTELVVKSVRMSVVK